jgi:hypothetical protein
MKNNVEQIPDTTTDNVLLHSYDESSSAKILVQLNEAFVKYHRDPLEPDNYSDLLDQLHFLENRIDDIQYEVEESMLALTEAVD